MYFPRFAPPSASLRTVDLPVEIHHHIYSYLNLPDLRSLLRVNTTEQSIIKSHFRRRAHVDPIIVNYLAKGGQPVKIFFRLVTKADRIGNTDILKKMYIDLSSIKFNIQMPAILVYLNADRYNIYIFNNHGQYVYDEVIDSSSYVFDHNMNSSLIQENEKIVVLRALDRLIKHNNYLLYTIDKIEIV